MCISEFWILKTLNILCPIPMLKFHGIPVPNQVQIYKCWGSKGAVGPHWYDAVQHDHICRPMTFSYNAISAHIFPLHPDTTCICLCLCAFLRVARCQLLLWSYCFSHSSILKSKTNISNVFLEIDFSHESPVHFSPLLDVSSLCYLINLSAVNCLARDANFPNFIQ